MKSHPEPHDCLVAWLLVQSMLEKRSDGFFKPLALTGAQFNILNLLGHSGHSMDQAQLVERLLVGKSSISTVLNRMVREGLIRREVHPKDRRQVVLHLSTKGLALWRKISPRYEAGVQTIFGALPARDRQQFLASLKVLHDAFLSEKPAGADDRWSSYFSTRIS